MSRDDGAEPTPRALRGLWRREEIFAPGGYRDATTRVLWLQTQRYYADIRVPADRPSAPDAAGFGAFSDDQLTKLAGAQGFAGVLTVSGEMCFWRRDLDFQPPGETPDEARFEIKGDWMGEYGVHADYTEIWRREADSDAPLAALRYDVGPGGVLVIGGDHFLEIVGRTAPLPAGESLAAIVQAELTAGRRDRAEAHLAMRICYGRIAHGGTPWRILLSSLPWLEGRCLFEGETPRFDPAAGALWRREEEAWRVEDSSLPLADLAALF